MARSGATLAERIRTPQTGVIHGRPPQLRSPPTTRPPPTSAATARWPPRHARRVRARAAPCRGAKPQSGSGRAAPAFEARCGITPLTRFGARGELFSVRSRSFLRPPGVGIGLPQLPAGSRSQGPSAMAAIHHYELGPNASAQIYSPARRLASHSYVRRSRGSVRHYGLASRGHAAQRERCRSEKDGVPWMQPVVRARIASTRRNGDSAA